jgi:lipoprotein-releasing system ATP-binding protein
MITATGVHKSYGSLHVLKGINLTIKKAEVISIVGASGAGKSTLLHILGTLDRADKGHIEFNAEDIVKLNGRKLANFRNRHIGFVFQQHHLLPEFTAVENVSMPSLIAGKSKSEAVQHATYLLEKMGLKERLQHRPSALSGGEQQRVAVARALVNNPEVIFADEPSGNLDSIAATSLHQLFFSLRQEFGQTFVIVTHNDQLANMADRKLTMKDGMII